MDLSYSYITLICSLQYMHKKSTVSTKSKCVVCS